MAPGATPITYPPIRTGLLLEKDTGDIHKVIILLDNFCCTFGQFLLYFWLISIVLLANFHCPFGQGLNAFTSKLPAQSGPDLPRIFLDFQEFDKKTMFFPLPRR